MRRTTENRGRETDNSPFSWHFLRRLGCSCPSGPAQKSRSSLLSRVTWRPSSGLPGHRQPRKAAGGPGVLEIESAGDPIDVEELPCEMQPRHEPALHRLE